MLDHLQIYLQEIAKNKSLSLGEEKKLIKLVREGDKKAKDKLVKANLRFVISVAKKYQNYGVDFADLIGAGNQGLLKSLNFFDENKNFKLITYAVWWIRQHILLAMANHSRVVKIPLISIAQIKKIRETCRKLEQKHHRSITTDDISQEINKTNKFVTRIQILDAPSISLNTIIFEDIELLDTITYTKELIDPKLKKFIDALINSLKDEREREVVKMYFGVDYDSSKTLDEIGKKFDISRERVRQIKTKALTNLQKASKIIKTLNIGMR